MYYLSRAIIHFHLCLAFCVDYIHGRKRILHDDSFQNHDTEKFMMLHGRL